MRTDSFTSFVGHMIAYQVLKFIDLSNLTWNNTFKQS